MFSQEFFQKIGFAKEATTNTYTKKAIARRYQIAPKAFVQLERTLMFKIHDVHEELGVNIEFFVDNRLADSGYWYDEDDFLTHKFNY